MDMSFRLGGVVELGTLTNSTPDDLLFSAAMIVALIILSIWSARDES